MTIVDGRGCAEVLVAGVELGGVELGGVELGGVELGGVELAGELATVFVPVAGA